jgi:hypothetical protein
MPAKSLKPHSFGTLSQLLTLQHLASRSPAWYGWRCTLIRRRDCLIRHKSWQNRATFFRSRLLYLTNRPAVGIQTTKLQRVAPSLPTRRRLRVWQSFPAVRNVARAKTCARKTRSTGQRVGFAQTRLGNRCKAGGILPSAILRKSAILGRSIITASSIRSSYLCTFSNSPSSSNFNIGGSKACV